MGYEKYDTNRGRSPFKKFIPIISVGAALAVAAICIFAIPHGNAYQRVVPKLGVNQPSMTLAYAEDYKEIRDVLNAAEKIRGSRYIDLVEGGEWLEDAAAEEKGMADPGAVESDSSSQTTGNSSQSGDADNKDYSDTNEQVEGVHEADVVKTDGRYIYSTSSLEKGIKIVDTKTEKLVATIDIDDWSDENVSSDFEMYYNDDHLVVVASKYSDFYSYNYGYEDEQTVA